MGYGTWSSVSGVLLLLDRTRTPTNGGTGASLRKHTRYDLAVKRERGFRINVEGTRNVLAFLQDCSHFDRLHYVSTAYVSGDAEGVYGETDLDVGQGFKNFYEETKFLAEVEVAKSQLPRTVYRPGIVVGDSRTGETGKFDGPYFVLAAWNGCPRRASSPDSARATTR